MKLNTVESLLKEYHELTPKDMWWLLAMNEDPEIIEKWQTTFPQMMNQIRLLVKENKIMLTDDGYYIWIYADSPKLKKMLRDAVPLE